MESVCAHIYTAYNDPVRTYTLVVLSAGMACHWDACDSPLLYSWWLPPPLPGARCRCTLRGRCTSPHDNNVMQHIPWPPDAVWPPYDHNHHTVLQIFACARSVDRYSFGVVHQSEYHISEIWDRGCCILIMTNLPVAPAHLFHKHTCCTPKCILWCTTDIWYCPSRLVYILTTTSILVHYNTYYTITSIVLVSTLEHITSTAMMLTAVLVLHIGMYITEALSRVVNRAVA